MADQRPKRGRPENKTPRHKKKPSNQKKASNRAKKRRNARTAPSAAHRQRVRSSRLLDPSAAPDAETRFLQPYQATKAYLCPGCNREIPAGMGHIVAVPPAEPDLRRHWHRGCWNNRDNL